MCDYPSFQPIERLPQEELASRHSRCREHLARLFPSAEGFLVMGTPNIYYMSGTAANGLLWLPREGQPVLAVRKGLERARMESPLDETGAVVPFRSYKELAKIFAEFGSPFTGDIAADQAGVSWEQGRLLAERLPGQAIFPGDAVLARTRAIKSEWELVKIREASRRTHLGHMELARRIKPGMSEYQIGQTLWNIFAGMGNNMFTHTGTPGSSMLLGHFCVGDNGNHSSAYDGPVGVRGVHPAVPVMGSFDAIWREGQFLSVDAGFVFDGYIADRTQTYFAGKEAAIPAIARKAQDACIAVLNETAAMLRPGTAPADIYAKSLEIAEKCGFAETFMGTGGNKVRFIGHGIGLTISEWPICARGFAEPLVAGMTMALEPKIALPGTAMVGVENTYEITETGAISLTGDDNDILCV
ncbi:MAG: Methionine aminopeptidase 1, mitochondrial [Desulfovibrio sp.]